MVPSRFMPKLTSFLLVASLWSAIVSSCGKNSDQDKNNSQNQPSVPNDENLGSSGSGGSDKSGGSGGPGTNPVPIPKNNLEGSIEMVPAPVSNAEIPPPPPMPVGGILPQLKEKEKTKKEILNSEKEEEKTSLPKRESGLLNSIKDFKFSSEKKKSLSKEAKMFRSEFLSYFEKKNAIGLEFVKKNLSLSPDRVFTELTSQILSNALNQEKREALYKEALKQLSDDKSISYLQKKISFIYKKIFGEEAKFSFPYGEFQKFLRSVKIENSTFEDENNLNDDESESEEED